MKTTTVSLVLGRNRRRKPKKVKEAPSFAPPLPDGGAKKSTSATSKTASSSADELISQLRDHIDQGRIFDARSIVHKLIGIEIEDPTSSSNLEPVRHLIEEVIAQSEHVESLLHQLHSDDDWTLAKQRSGVTVHFRREPNSQIHVVRAATTFDNFSPSDFVRFCSLFVETEFMHRWFPGKVMGPATVLSWHSKYSKVIQLRINVALPMISSRDAVVLGNGYHLPDRNAFLISTKTILEDLCRHCDIPKPDKGVVRMATDSIFYLQLIKSDAISFKMISRDDLKLKYVPNSLLNYLSQGHMPFEIMKTIHRSIRNFEGTVWEKKIRERGAYYTEIEEKVYDQLERWEKEGMGNIDSSKRLESLQSTQQKLISTNHVAESEGLQVFVSDENQRKGSRLNFIMPMIVCMSLFVSNLHNVVPTPDMLRDLVPASLLEVLGTENISLAIMITTCLVPLFAIISSVKRRYQMEPDTRRQHIIAVDNDATDETGAEFLPILNVNSEAEAKKGNAGLEEEDPNHIRKISDVTLSPQSQPADGLQQFIQSTTRTFPVPLPKLGKVRSTLGAGLRGMKKKDSNAIQ
ncbi:hypothetical protein ACHAW5_005478 [Stephanodiscus triporus]|uniref:Uncharacterized protein n=1 Tax=Stephanodiscus triporus TaxID=2934178 RepID=A0ABD3Q564_9STRA